jgi:hypothetical protein
MTIKGSGTLSISEIDAEFAKGKSLSSYRGTTWWTDAGATGTFSSGAIKISDFYNTRLTIPTFTAYILVVGGGGGGGAGTQDNIGGGGGGGGGGGVGTWQIEMQVGKGGVLSVAGGGAGGYYGSALFAEGGGTYTDNSWIRATAGGSSYITPAGSTATLSRTYVALGGQPGKSRYYYDSSALATYQESTPYRGGDGGNSYITYDPVGTGSGINSGGAYNSPGAGPAVGRGGGGGGGADDVTNTAGIGGNGPFWPYSDQYHGGGGSGGGDYSGGSPGGLGGGGHGGYQNTAGTNGLGGGGGGGGSYGGSAYTNGSNGGSGSVKIFYFGSTRRIASTNTTSETYNVQGNWWLHQFTTPGFQQFYAA